jgi:hypothetical protein
MATGGGLLPPALVYHLLLFGIDQTREATSSVNPISPHRPLATSLAVTLSKASCDMCRPSLYSIEWTIACQMAGRSIRRVWQREKGKA